MVTCCIYVLHVVPYQINIPLIERCGYNIQIVQICTLIGINIEFKHLIMAIIVTHIKQLLKYNFLYLNQGITKVYKNIPVVASMSKISIL